MTTGTPKKRWLLFTLLLLVAGSQAYLSLRPQIFTYLASGAQWILVTCGFATDDTVRAENDPLRKLLYASRMYNSTPPLTLSAADAEAERQYPGMGFGLVRTLNDRPVRVVVGGWAFDIPCHYFADARNCQPGDQAAVRLRVLSGGLKPINQATIGDFLDVRSPTVVRITLAAPTADTPLSLAVDTLPTVDNPPAGFAGYQPAADLGYLLYIPVLTPPTDQQPQQLRCTDPDWVAEKGIFHHCLMRFLYSPDVMVEVMFSAADLHQWRELRQRTRQLVSQLQAKADR